MKLSEAIRLSGMVSPQIRRAVSDGKGGTCAMGGAYLAIGKLDAYLDQTVHGHDIWGPIIDWPTGCPECGYKYEGSTLQYIIFHLNDRHHWTRAQIADWVASVEQIMELEAAEANQATKEPTCVSK